MNLAVSERIRGYFTLIFNAQILYNDILCKSSPPCMQRGAGKQLNSFESNVVFESGCISVLEIQIQFDFRDVLRGMYI